MKYSMMSYTLSRQTGFDVRKMFEITARLKLDAVDMITLYNQKPEDIRKMADDHGIRIICYTFWADLNFPSSRERIGGIDLCRKAFESAFILGSDKVMLPVPAKQGIARRQARKNWIQGLNELMPFAENAGLLLSIENFSGESPFVTSGDFLEASREIPGLKLTYDNGNAATGEDPAESFRKTADYVVHAHFKDWHIRSSDAEGYRKMLDGRYYSPALIGEGQINQKDCLREMKKANYEGYIDIEYETDKYKAEEAVARALKYLKNAEAELR